MVINQIVGLISHILNNFCFNRLPDIVYRPIYMGKVMSHIAHTCAHAQCTRVCECVYDACVLCVRACVCVCLRAGMCGSYSCVFGCAFLGPVPARYVRHSQICPTKITKKPQDMSDRTMDVSDRNIKTRQDNKNYVRPI